MSRKRSRLAGAALSLAAVLSTWPTLTVANDAPSAASPTVVDITGRTPGTLVSLRTGDLVEVRLPVRAGAGYTWQFVDTGAGVVEDTGERSLSLGGSEGDPRVGGDAVQTLRLRTLRAGRQTVIFEYRRPWEAEVAPVRTLSWDIDVVD